MTLRRRGKNWFLKIAKAVAGELKLRVEGTALRVRSPHQLTVTQTDGWAATIGDLGKNRPRLEVWYDNFTGHDHRNLLACISGSRSQLMRLTKRVADVFVPHRVITPVDTTQKDFLVLSEPLRRDEFNVPVLEKHQFGETYFGIYDRTKQSDNRVNPSFIQEAATFFADVAGTLRQSESNEETYEVFPRYENRIKVRLHLRRERSRFLANARKQKDNYTCQVCNLRFPELYGEIGEQFAESHHLVPLARLRENVKTKIEDLITVCANCHRILHRMDGGPDDIKRLRAIVLKHQRRLGTDARFRR